MGQKTHPKGFRLISTQKHLSNWYSNNKKYSNFLLEDTDIRLDINKILNNYLTIADINIERINNNSNALEYINITINALYPRFKDCFSQILKYSIEINYNFQLNLKESLTLNINKKKHFEDLLKMCKFSNLHLKDLFTFLLIHKLIIIIRSFSKKFKKIIFINIQLIKNIFDNVNLIAKYICKQLEQRVGYKYIIKEIINTLYKTNPLIYGIKIQISGRLNGADIANTEWKKNKNMPLHTLYANIDYSFQTAKTIYGLLGIKVWLYLK
jgi:ribosomal protein S3